MLRHKIKLFKKKVVSLQTFRDISFDFDIVKNGSDVIKHYFCLSTEETNNYIEKHRLQRKAKNDLIDTISYCEEIGFDKTSIFENPALLRTHCMTLDHRYCVLKEGGFETVDAKILGRFRKHFTEIIANLKRRRFIDQKTDVTESFVDHLDRRPTKSYDFDDGGFNTFIRVHELVLFNFLEWRLQASPDVIRHLLSIHNSNFNKSFGYLCDNIKFVESLGFSSEKIIKNGYILHCYPKYRKKIIEQYPTIGGVPIARVIKMHPRIIGIKPSHIGEILDLLESYNITDDAISRRLGVFLIAPNTVNQRLQELTKSPDFNLLIDSPDFLDLVTHVDRAKLRLSSLKELDHKCIGNIRVLARQEKVFEDYVKECKDLNALVVLKTFLKKKLKTDDVSFFPLFRKHPFHRQVPLASIENTFLFLIDEGFTHDSIMKAIFILLYPRDKLAQAFKQMRQDEMWSVMEKDQVKQLNFAHYIIEKDHHFSGDGIWVDREVPAM